MDARPPEPEPPPPPPATGWRSERARWWLALASYVVLAVLFVGPGNLTNAMQVAGQGIDLPGTVWIHWWVRTTLEQGTLPVTTDLLFYPDGKNFFADTGANYLDAYLGVPFQWVFGVPGFMDPLALVILVGNSLAFAALARDLTGGRWGPAWAATVAFSLNPFLLRQLGEGRPTQAMLWFVILAVRYALRLRTGTPRDAALFGVFTALSALTYWFNAYFIAFGLLPFALWELARAPRVVAPRIALAVGVALLLTAPFLVGIAHEIDAGAVRRLQYTNWGDGPAAAGSRWRDVMTDFGAATWIAAFFLGLAAWRRSGILLLGGLFALLTAIGAQLDVTDPMIRNYLVILLWDHLPLFSRLGFPDRATCMTFLMLSLGAAYGLSRLDAVWVPLFALGVLGEAFWSTNLPLPNTVYVPSPCASYVRAHPGPVIALPLGSSESAMITQTAHGQPMFGGMGEREPDLRPNGYDERIRNTFLINIGATLSDSHPPIGYTLADREAITSVFKWAWYDLKFTPPSWSAAGFNGEAVVRQLTKELGEPVMRVGRCAVFDLQGPVPTNAPGLDPSAKRATDELIRLGISNVDAAAAMGERKHPGLPPPRETP